MDDSKFISMAVNRMPASGIRDFFEFLDQNVDVISLAVGQPDFMTPQHISNAASESMLEGNTGYTSNYGLIELRELLSKHLNSLYGVSYNPTNEMLFTSGVSEALDIAVRAIVDPGDEVIVPEPAYVAYKPVILLAGADPGFIPQLTGRQNVTELALAYGISKNELELLLYFLNRTL